MTSAKKLQANRVNARASTGPRTRAGKATASKNALRHGLTLPLEIDGPMAVYIDQQVGNIAGETASPTLQHLARILAEAEANVVRIRLESDRIFLRDLRMASEVRSLLPDPAPWHASVLSGMCDELRPIYRYQRRAFSRLNSAILAFDQAANSKD